MSIAVAREWTHHAEIPPAPPEAMRPNVWGGLAPHPQLWADLRDTSPETVAKRKRMRAVWLSERDCIQLIDRCLQSDQRWGLVYGISDNPRQFWDLGHARGLLGYNPRDGAPERVE